MTPNMPDGQMTSPLRVTRPSQNWVLWAGVAGVVMVALLVLVAMSAARTRTSELAASDVAVDTAPPAPPPLEPIAVADESASEPSIPAPYMVGQGEAPAPTPQAAMPGAPKPNPLAGLIERWRTPAVIVDVPAASAAGPAAPQTVATAAAMVPTPEAGGKGDTDEAFARRVGSAGAETVRSSIIAEPSRTAPQGTVLPAVLETAVNSDLPGFVRAVVSRDVRAFDGATVVVPRGSKLVGQYRSAVAAGQSRAFVVWTRLIRPDGVTIDLASPATDTLGRSGLTGETDRHFFTRFGSAILLSVLNTGMNAIGGRGGDNIVIGSSQDASRVAEIALQKQIDIPPTLSVPQGAPIRVFVAKDLVFQTPAK